MQVQKCPSCGGMMQFSPAVQKLQCENCGTVQDFEQELSLEKHVFDDYKKNLNAAAHNQNAENKTIMECRSCGATIEMSAHITSGSCPYCDARIVLAEKAVQTLPPDGLRPFAILHKDIATIFKTWIKKRWFAPNALKTLYQRGKVSGMYLPYWVFDVDTACTYTARGGIDRTEHYTDSDGKSCTRTVTDWYNISGSLSYDFKNRLMRASQTIKESLVRNLGGFNLNETVRFDPLYLAGYASEVFKIEMPAAYQDAQSEMESDLIKLIEKKELSRYDKVNSIVMDIDWSNEFYRLVLLPVYSMPYSFKNKTYQVLINGENGLIVGDRPYSPIKIALAIIAALIAIGFIIYFYNS